MNDVDQSTKRRLPSILKMALLAGAKDSVVFQLRRGADINGTDDRGRTPLMLAASRGHVELCRLLIEAGADLALVDAEGLDALQIATNKGSHELVEIVKCASDNAPSRGTIEDLDGILEPNGASQTHNMSTVGDGSAPVTPLETEKNSISELFPPYMARTSLAAHSDTRSESADTSEFDGADEFDLSEWQVEPEAPTPITDPDIAVLAKKIQWEISRHRPIDNDADWDNVEIDLPELLASVRRTAFLSGSDEAELRRFIISAMQTGRALGQRILEIAPRDQELKELPNLEYVANLRRVLEELSIIIDDEADPPDSTEDVEINDRSEDYIDDAAEALSYLAVLNSGQNDPLALYVGEVPNRKLSREQEASLARQIEAQTRIVLGAIAFSPLALNQLLSTVEAVVVGAQPLSDLVALERDDPTETSPAWVDDDFDEPILTIETGIPETALQRIMPLRETCRALFACDSAVVDAGLSAELGDMLWSLPLSHDLLEALQRAVSEDPHGKLAQASLQTALDAARKLKLEFAEANLKLVVWQARKSGGLTWSDRIQEGNIGLLKAIERYDYNNGAKFATYAIWWIRQSISRAVAVTARTIRIPVHFQEESRRFEKISANFMSVDGYPPTAEDLAVHAGVSKSRAKKFLETPGEPTSIDTEEGWDEAASLPSPDSSPDEILSTKQLQTRVNGHLECLNAREATIIRLRFGLAGNDDHTLEEIGQMFNVTRERIRQIEARALGKLKHPGRIKALQGLL